MDLTVDEFIEGFFAEGTEDEPVHSRRPDAIQLPPWFDENKFNQGRRFFYDNRAAIIAQVIFGEVLFLSVPSILRVLIATKRSSSVYTAFKRYLATYVLVLSWMSYELKPGTVSWRALEIVRLRHFKVSSTTRHKNVGVVSQRDMGLTVSAFFGFVVLRPEKLGIRATQPGDWDAFVFSWRVISYMLGIQDKYNVCRNTVEETRQVFDIINRRVFTPCLDYVPEHFEHMARVALEGIWNVSVLSDTSAIWLAKWLAGVPGYVYFEQEKNEFREKLRAALKGKPLDTPIDTTELLEKCAVFDLPKTSLHHLYLKDFETVDYIPSYNQLSWYEKRKIDITILIFHLLNYSFFRYFLTIYVDFVVFMMQYIPWFAVFSFGRNAFGNIFRETPTDDTNPLPNKVFYDKEKYRDDKNVMADLKKAGLKLN